MDYNSFEKQISESKLPPAEQKLADYLLKNFSSIPFCTIEEICGELKVSKATMGRLMSNIGLYGFSHFKRKVSKTLKKHTLEKPYHRISLNNPNMAQLIDTHFTEAIKNIEKVQADFVVEDFLQIAEYLSQCKGKIYIVGAASSSAIALYLHGFLQYFKTDVILLNTEAMPIVKNLINVQKDDILFSISYFRYAKTSKKIVDYFHQKEAKIIVLTDNIVNPFAIKCDIEIILPSQTSGIFNSRLMAIFYIEMLLKAIAAKLGDEERFQQFEKLFPLFDIFMDLEAKEGDEFA